MLNVVRKQFFEHAFRICAHNYTLRAVLDDCLTGASQRCHEVPDLFRINAYMVLVVDEVQDKIQLIHRRIDSSNVVRSLDPSEKRSNTTVLLSFNQKAEVASLRASENDANVGKLSCFSKRGELSSGMQEVSWQPPEFIRLATCEGLLDPIEINVGRIYTVRW